MSIAFDAVTESGSFTASGTSFNHTPVGTPSGILVFICHSGDHPDRVTGVTYGGVAMARTSNGYAKDAIGEFGAVYAYFLGSGIPTGTQPVVITHTDATNPWEMHCVSVTSTTGASSVAIAGLLENDGTSPSVTLDSGSDESLRFAACWSGLPNVTDLTNLAGQTQMGTEDFGANIWKSVRQNTPATGSVSIGFSSVTTDDIAMIGVAIKETAVAAGNFVPTTIIS